MNVLAFETCWAKIKQVTSVGMSLFNYTEEMSEIRFLLLEDDGITVGLANVLNVRHIITTLSVS